MTKLGQTYTVKAAMGDHKEWTFVACPRCGNAVSIQTHPRRTALLNVSPRNNDSTLDVDYLPDNVAQPYSNARIVLDAGVPSSAAVELRRTLEAAALAHGVTVTPLYRAIEKLADEGYITHSFKDVLGHIKKIGNAGAHAGSQDVSEEEARQALRFTTQVLRNLFEVPAELGKLGQLPAEESE